jgi:hypothetical protein
MTTPVAEVLSDLVARHNKGLVADPARLRALLADLSPMGTPPWQIHILVEVAQTGVGLDMWRFQGNAVDELVFSRWLHSLVEATGAREEVATWALDCWMKSLAATLEETEGENLSLLVSMPPSPFLDLPSGGTERPYSVAGKGIEKIQAYCVNDREMVDIKNPEQIRLKDGHMATRGTCPKCGTRVTRRRSFDPGTSVEDKHQPHSQPLAPSPLLVEADDIDVIDLGIDFTTEPIEIDVATEGPPVRDTHIQPLL